MRPSALTMLSSLRYEIRESRRYLRAILYLALSDLRGRYQRSVLGPLWLTLGTLVAASGLSFIWSELMHKDMREFLPTLAAGLILWQFISGVLGEAPSLFVRQVSLIRNMNLPLSIYPMQLLLRHLLNLMHYVPALLLLMPFTDIPLSSTTLLVIPGLLLSTLNLLWIALLLGLLGARFRDIDYLIATTMPILMLLSPVFYRPDFLPVSEYIIWLNPVSHLIEIVRYPLLGMPAPGFVIWTSLAFLVFGTLATWRLFQLKRHRIAFWV